MRPPVCITGMHRSGTSMAAMLLGACGLELGPPSDLAVANADNPLGFWEDLRFVRLNDAILRRSGGRWDQPPVEVRPPGRGPSERWLEHRARWLLRRAGRSRPWGWKDPRTALTLPFWTSLVPALKVVICLRRPGAVAASLSRRVHQSSDEGEALWLLYNERLLASVPRERRIIVAHDHLLSDLGDALTPVLDFVGLPTDRAASPDLRALVRPELQCPTPGATFSTSAECETLYRSMLAEVGEPRPARGHRPAGGTGPS